MKRILFVDDEPNVLEGLKRMLFPLRKEWEMEFATSGRMALELMDQKPVDLIVSDMRMPGMDGAELLAQVRARYPQTIRFVLSGQSDRETIFRSVGAAHQFLSKPCNPQELKATIDRAFALREIFGSEKVSQIVSRIRTLPPLPETYAQLMTLIQSPECSISDVAHVIEKDIAMTAKILQLVNSAFFGITRKITNVIHAVSLLGLDTVRSLVLIAGLFETSSFKKIPQELFLDHLWHHSITVGWYAQTIAREEKVGPGRESEALTAGLLHDAGKIVLASALTSEYEYVLNEFRKGDKPISEIERDTLGCTHAEVGAYLLGLWGLPDPIVEAVAYHHHPSDCSVKEFCSLAAVHAANYFAYRTLAEKGKVINLTEIDEDFLTRTNLKNRVPIWESVCFQLQNKEKTNYE